MRSNHKLQVSRPAVARDYARVNLSPAAVMRVRSSWIELPCRTDVCSFCSIASNQQIGASPRYRPECLGREPRGDPTRFEWRQCPGLSDFAALGPIYSSGQSAASSKHVVAVSRVPAVAAAGREGDFPDDCRDRSDGACSTPSASEMSRASERDAVRARVDDHDHVLALDGGPVLERASEGDHHDLAIGDRPQRPNHPPVVGALVRRAASSPMGHRLANPPPSDGMCFLAFP